MNDLAHGENTRSAARLAALARFGILDTPPEAAFDDIVQLAAQLCQVPIALISLLDADRQWFKARIGFAPSETPISQSVCAFAPRQRDVLVIPDLTLDPRTVGNTLVTGNPGLRFYAGAQLETSDGVAIGTLCVIDTVARPAGLTPEQTTSLRALARLVMSQLSLRRAVALREEAIEAQATAEDILREDARQHGALLRLQTAIEAAAGDFDTILNTIASGALDILPHADAAAIEIREGDTLAYKAVSGLLLPHLGQRLPINRSMSGLSIREGRPLRTGDAQNDPRLDTALAQKLGLRSMIVVPIARSGQFVGVLKLQSSKIDAFTERDSLRVQLLAGIVAAGLGSVAEGDVVRRLRQSEDRLDLAFEAAGALGWWDWDIANDRVVANALFAEMYAVDPEAAARGVPVATFVQGIHPEDRERVGNSIQQAVEEAGEFHEEYRLMQQDGSIRWVFARGRSYFDAAGRPKRFPGVTVDLTKRKVAETALARAEERQRQATQAANVGVWEYDFASGVLVQDDLCRVMYGQSAGALVTLAQNSAAIHPDDRDRVVALFAAAADPDGPGDYAAEYRTIGIEDGVERWLSSRGRVRFEARTPIALFGIVQDITARKATERLQAALLKLGDQLRDAVDPQAAAFIAADVIGRTLGGKRAGYASFDADAETAYVSKDWTAPGTASMAGLHSMATFGRFTHDLKQGKLVSFEDASEDPRTADQADALLRVGARALLNMPIIEQGRLVAIMFLHDAAVRSWSDQEIAFFREATARAREAIARVTAEERQKVLNHELSHRMKNTLTMVQAIATQTMRNASSIEAVRDTLSARLMALGKAHDILMSSSNERTRLVPLLQGAISLHDDGQPERFRLSGLDVDIGPRAALSLMLILHELATNAVKYGALSVAEGVVSIVWSIEGPSTDPEFSLVWQEQGGPIVTPPSRKGFGSKLIERGLAGAVGGSMVLAYEPAGVRCRLKAPLFGLQAGD